MSRYPNGVQRYTANNWASRAATRGPAAQRTFGARAVALPVPRAPLALPKMPKIPAPPASLIFGIAGALLITNGIGMLNSTAPDPRYETVGGNLKFFGQYRARTKLGALPIGLGCANSASLTIYQPSSLWQGAYFINGPCGPNDPPNRGVHGARDVFPPNIVTPHPEIEIKRPMQIPGLLPGEWARNPPSTAVPLPTAIPARPPAVLIGSRGTAFTQAGTINPMFPTSEQKYIGSLGFVNFVNAYVGAGGEAIDVMRCMLFAAGHTYLNRNGEEVVIPKDQWGEVFSGPRMNLSGAKGVVYGGGWGKTSEAVRSLLDNSDKPHDAYGKRITPREMGMRATECLFLNWLTDGLVAAKGKATRQMAKDLRLNLGPLGIDSQIAMMNGDPAYAGVFDLNL